MPVNPKQLLVQLPLPQVPSAPFTMIKASPRTPEPMLEDKLTHLTETLYRMDIDSKPPKKPFKPFITPPHRKFKGSFDKGRGGKRRMVWSIWPV